MKEANSVVLQMDQIQEADYKAKCFVGPAHCIVGKHSHNLQACGMIGALHRRKGSWLDVEAHCKSSVRNMVSSGVSLSVRKCLTSRL